MLSSELKNPLRKTQLTRGSDSDISVRLRLLFMKLEALLLLSRTYFRQVACQLFEYMLTWFNLWVRKLSAYWNDLQSNEIQWSSHLFCGISSYLKIKWTEEYQREKIEVKENIKLTGKNIVKDYSKRTLNWEICMFIIEYTSSENAIRK